MKIVKCVNEKCDQHDVDRNFLGNPNLVMCGACWEPCELGELTDDPDLRPISEP